MLFPVKVYTPDNKLKETIDTPTLSKRHWKEINIDIGLVKDLKARKSNEEPCKIKPRHKNAVPIVCAIWPIICGYRPCSSYAIKRSPVGKYCSPECLRLETNRKKRSK